MKDSSKLSAMVDIADLDLPVGIDDFVLGVNMDVSGSGIQYLNHNAFAVYDYPAAEVWLKEECSWDHTYHRLGDGTFHYVVFNDSQGAVEFKLRWGREVTKYVR